MNMRIGTMKSYSDLPANGRKEVLTGRAHSAWEAKLPVIKKQKQREGILDAEYRSLLEAGYIHLPDLKCELQDWIVEDEGIKKWRHTRIVDLKDSVGKLGMDNRTALLR